MWPIGWSAGAFGQFSADSSDDDEAGHCDDLGRAKESVVAAPAPTAWWRRILTLVLTLLAAACAWVMLVALAWLLWHAALLAWGSR